MYNVFDRIMNMGTKELFIPLQKPNYSRMQEKKKKEELFSWSFDVATYNAEDEV
jgi:hypothetical protein